MENLDDKDRKLLGALKKNSRASLVSLGRDIGLSRSATHDRITRLEETGVITAYTISIDENYSPKAKAFLTVHFEPGYANSSITKKISSKIGVVSAYCLTGNIDTLVYCECDDMLELSELRDDIANMAGVLEIHTRNLLSAHGLT